MKRTMFSLSLMIHRSSIKCFHSCIRHSPKVLYRLCDLVNHNAIGIRYNVPVSYRSETQVDAGITSHEQENNIDSDVLVRRSKPVQLMMIHETLSNKQPLTEDEMCNFRNQILNGGSIVTESNIDAIIIGCCTSLKNLEFADSYLNFLEKRNFEINAATSARYLKLCYASGQVNDENKVLQLCRHLREKHPLMDASTAENVIHGLSITSEWRQGLDLINMIKETSSPNSSTYSALIIAAFKNEDLQLGWYLMEECVKEGRTPLDMVYLVWLDLFCAKNKADTSDDPLTMAEKLLNFFSVHEQWPSLEVAKKFKYIFEMMNWKGHFTSITERGTCMSCRAEMLPILITRSEFKALSKTFLEKVLVGPDVFAKSSPEEVEDFQRLVANNAPYNTVIDGLNVAYSTGAGGKVPPHKCAAILKSVVEHFVDLSHKILVLGRSHMDTWPKREMEYIRKNSQMFLAQNLSQDDPFLLYAAMSSGPGTCFLSRDLMRGHAYRLKCADPSLSSVFHRWQISHQMRLMGISNNRRVNIKQPLEYSPTVQKVDGKWHIPYQEEEQEPVIVQEDRKLSMLTRSHLDPPTHWLCLSQKRSGEKFYGRKAYGANMKYNRNY